MSVKKTAVDSIAEKYWEDYYSETGYGKLWVRKIPMKIKAALKLPKTAAKVAEDFRIDPIASVQTEAGVSLEGFLTANGKRLAFSADFSHTGDVLDFVTAEVK